MDLAEDPEIHMDAETCMLRLESDTWILQRIPRYIWMLIYGSGDMDLAEDPEI